jgi:putative transcriptional regulator
LIENGRVFVNLPTVEDHGTLKDELAKAGIAAAPIEPPKTPDGSGLRERLRLTREQFASRYGLELETMRNGKTANRSRI